MTGPLLGLVIAVVWWWLGSASREEERKRAEREADARRAEEAARNDRDQAKAREKAETEEYFEQCVAFYSRYTSDHAWKAEIGAEAKAAGDDKLTQAQLSASHSNQARA